MRIKKCLLIAAWSWSAITSMARSEAMTENKVDIPRFVAQIVATHNNQGLPFMVVDKVRAQVWIFSDQGALVSMAPALLGLALGDVSIDGIGSRKLANIRPAERITPAGRFVSFLGRNLQGHEVLWVDYDGAVSLHRVIMGKASEQRARRLATPTPLDNRISFGCINVPAKFFNASILPTVREKGSIVYVLPETLALSQVFNFINDSSGRE